MSERVTAVAEAEASPSRPGLPWLRLWLPLFWNWNIHVPLALVVALVVPFFLSSLSPLRPLVPLPPPISPSSSSSFFSSFSSVSPLGPSASRPACPPLLSTDLFAPTCPRTEAETSRILLPASSLPLHSPRSSSFPPSSLPSSISAYTAPALPRYRSDTMVLAAAAQKVAKEFEYSADNVRKAVKEFIREMDEGLKADGTDLSQIPTYVTAVPNGTEKGLYMAVDLGGTNFRVCSIQLHGNSTFTLTQSKVAIPKELMVAQTSKELFSFLAKQIERFLKDHHKEHYAGFARRKEDKSAGGYKEEEVFNLGFTFSFPVRQVGINKGYLMRWTKGFDIKDTIGKDVCALLQDEINALHLPVRVAALVNDTVGTLMARSYTSPGKQGTLLGAIFGTGTNGAYVEKLENVKKLTSNASSEGTYDSSTGEMIVNTEWGSFDNSLKVLPKTEYDIELDEKSVNPGIQMFEKRVSGMFLGEILRLALVKLAKDPAIPLFKDENSSVNDSHTTTCISDDSALWKQWGVDTSLLSITEADQSDGLKATRQALDQQYGVYAADSEDALAVRTIAAAIGKRAARLAAVSIAAVVLQTGRIKDDVIDVGVDGSVVEFYPGFEAHIREALREVPEIGAEGEKKVQIGIAKDGSGVGAALIALVAGRVESPAAGGKIGE